MKKISITFLFFIAAVLSGCYEDKGNYDYKDIQQLDISFEKGYYKITFGEELKIEPELNTEVYGDTSRYEYKWTVNGETRPEWNRLNFSWTVDRMFKSGKVVLEITDRETGLVYMYQATVDVSGIYENAYSWIILSEVEGKSRLSYFSNLEYDDEKEEFKSVRFYEDVYTAANAGELGRGPLALQVHFRQSVDYKDEVVGNVCVFQQSGAVDLSGETFEKQIDLSEAFDGGHYPEGAVIYPGTFMDRIDVVADQYGQLYSRFKAVSTVYNSEYFLQEPLAFGEENEPLKACRVIRGFYRANRTGYALIYDGGKKRMLYIVNSDYYDEITGAGKISALPACGEGDDPSRIVPLDNMEGYEMLKAAMFGFGYPDYGFFLLMKEESTGKVFLQILKITGSAGKPRIVEIKRHEVKGLPGIPSTAAFPLSNPDYVFFAVGNEVYYYDLNNTENPARLYKGFEAKVTVINAESEYGDHMAVGLENGDFYILLIRDAKNTPEAKKVLYTSEQKVGRIVDIQYKQLDHWNY